MKKNILIVAGIVAMMIVYHFTFNNNSLRKVGVVDLDKLVYDYKGMKDATKLFSGKMENWSSTSDSIKQVLNQYMNDIKMDSINNDKEKLKKDKAKFLLLRDNYLRYQQNIQQHSQQEDQNMTVGVINQIREHIKNYAKEEGYDMILTNRQIENVGYVKEAAEITEEVLDFANAKYNGNN